MTKFQSHLFLTAFLAILAFLCQGFLWTANVNARPRHSASVQQEEEEAEDETEEEDEQQSDETEEVSDEEGDEQSAGADEDEEDVDEDEYDPNAPLPKPEKVFGARLECKDGVQLSATFFPGNRGKKSVPVILMHNWGGTRADVKVLAEELQKIGCAVLVPDLRGHGKSTKRRVGPETLKSFTAGNKIMADDLEEIISLDFPCLKKFLMQKNNAGQLNIDKMCVGGVGYGGIAAAFYANADWNPMVKRNKKDSAMGDVKGFFIVAPPKPLKGVNFKNVITFPNWGQNVSCLVLSSGAKNKKNSKSMETFMRKTCGTNALARCWFKNYEVDGTDEELIMNPDSDFVLDVLAFVDKRGIQRDVLWKSR